MDKHSGLEDRLVDFAVRIINVVEALPTSKAGNHTASRSSYFTNQQSPIVNHQSTERACRFGAKRYLIIDATIDRFSDFLWRTRVYERRRRESVR